MSNALRSPAQVTYRCHACEYEFARSVPGVATCPRCQSIGGHERHEASR